MPLLLALFFFFIYVGEPIGLNKGLGPGMSVKNLILYTTLVGIAINAAVARNRNLDLPSIFVPFGILVFYALMTAIVVIIFLDYPDYGTRETLVALKSSLIDHYITFLVFFFGVINLRGSTGLLRVMIAISVVGVVVALIDTFNVPNLGMVDARVRGERFIGFIGSANGYGQFLVLILPLSIALHMTASGHLRSLTAIGVLSTAMSLVLTGSRGAYAGLIFGGVAAACYLRGEIRTAVLLRISLGAAVVVVLAAVIAIFAGYGDVFMDRFSRFEGGSHLATSGRSTIWAAAIESMLEKPFSFIFGYGYHAYDNSREFYAATHNMYLTYLYDLGLIGLSLYCFVFLRILNRARHAIRDAAPYERRLLIAGVFGVAGFMVSIFFSEYHSSGYLLWGLLGVMMRLAVECKGAVPANHEDIGRDRSTAFMGAVT